MTNDGWGWGDGMTNDARRAAIRELIRRFTETVTADSATARRTLIAEGVYTNDGELAERYGGRVTTMRKRRKRR
jgi:hypothetical protein